MCSLVENRSVLRSSLAANTLRRMSLRIVLLAAACCLSFRPASCAEVVDFTTWTEVVDPFDPNFSASATSSSASLFAGNGLIAVGTDIGFQSVNGATPGSSSSGSFFHASNDFTIAIDYDLSFGVGTQGSLGLGFGIGEDSDGMNSAGVGLATVAGAPFLTFAGAARVNDQNLTPLPLGFTPSTLSGSLFVEYIASSGDVIVGAATSKSAIAPTVSRTFTGIQKQWNGTDLMASFFIRSDGSGWQGGTAEAVFENFRVIEGTATAVPEPTLTAGVGLALFIVLSLLLAPDRGRQRLACIRRNP